MTFWTRKQETKAEELMLSDMTIASLQKRVDGKLCWSGTDYDGRSIEIELWDALATTTPKELPVELGGGNVAQAGSGRWLLVAHDLDAVVVLHVEFSAARYRCSSGPWRTDLHFPGA